MKASFDLIKSSSYRLSAPSGRLYHFKKGIPLVISRPEDIEKIEGMKDVFFKVGEFEQEQKGALSYTKIENKDKTITSEVVNKDLLKEAEVNKEVKEVPPVESSFNEEPKKVLGNSKIVKKEEKEEKEKEDK